MTVTFSIILPAAGNQICLSLSLLLYLQLTANYDRHVVGSLLFQLFYYLLVHQYVLKL